MTDDIHSCSLYCDLPACIKRQRDEYRQGLLDALNMVKPEQPADHVEDALNMVKAAQPAQSTPLTDAHLCVLVLGIDYATKRLPPGYREFARAIESAHGIGTPQPAEGA